MSDSTLPLINFETAELLGLNRSEWSRIAERLGRAPNQIEATIFATLWSEEVGFRNSSSMLKTLEQESENITPQPGTFGGELSLGSTVKLIARTVQNDCGFSKDQAIGLPVAVAAALLGVAAQGAKPLGVSSSFYTSELDKADALNRFQKSINALSDFLRESGTLSLESNWYINELYAGNAMCGSTVVAIKEVLTELATSEPGDPVLIVGAPTGAERIPRKNDASSEDPSPTQPFPDPFLHYRLLETLAELRANGLLNAAVPLHYGGLAIGAIRLCEIITGTIELDLNRVPNSLNEQSSDNLLFSESSGRILISVPKNEMRKVSQIFSKWEISQQTCGNVAKTRGLEINYNHRIIADIPIKFALSGATAKEFKVVKFPPMLKSSDTASQAPTIPKKYKKKDDDDWSLIREASKITKKTKEDFPEPNSISDTWVDLLANINLASKRQLVELSDNKLGGQVVIEGEQEGKVVHHTKADGSRISIGIASASCALYTGVDPYLGMTHSVAYAMRKLAALGTSPIGLCFQLHYGNPEKYKEMCDLSECIRALGDATRHWEIPILDGDVSLGNGSDAYPLLPTPVISMFGRSESVTPKTFSLYPNEGDCIFTIGTTADEYLCSEYSKYIQHSLNSVGLPNIDFDSEAKTANLVRSLVSQQFLTSCRAVGPGGLGCSLASTVMGGAKPKGLTLELNSKLSRPDAQLFSESAGRYLLFTSPEKATQLEALLKENSIPIEGRGKVEGREFKITGSLECSMPVATAYRIWNQATDRALG